MAYGTAHGAVIDRPEGMAWTAPVAALHRRIRRTVRRVPARPRRLAAAVAAWRLIESLPHRGAARRRRLGSLQRDRRRRSRHAAGAIRLSHRRHPIDHLRGSAGAFAALAQAAHSMGCKPGWCTCARPAGSSASWVGSASRCFSSWSAAPYWRGWCIRCLSLNCCGSWRPAPAIPPRSPRSACTPSRWSWGTRCRSCSGCSACSAAACSAAPSRWR